MKLPKYFEKFLREIRPTDRQKEDFRRGHETLRNRLRENEGLKSIIIDTFLQGSYRRATAVRSLGDLRPDVDVIVVTSLNKDDYPNPHNGMKLFVPFLELHYKDKYRIQGRSFAIKLSYVDLDLVITAAPSANEFAIYESKAVIGGESPEEAPDWMLTKSWIPMSERESLDTKILAELARKEPEWKANPLWIPNRDTKDWERTNPLEQMKWTWGKNARTNGHYVNVVKSIKWWQRINHENDRPKGYPLEHLIGVCCPDEVQSVAEGVTLTLEAIVKDFKIYKELNEAPKLSDHGVPEHNVLARVSSDEFAQFYEHVVTAAAIAREALDSDSRSHSARKWRELFGEKFPPSGDKDEGEDDGGPFIPPPIKSQTGDLTPRKYGIND